LSDLTADELADLAVRYLGRPVRPEVLAAIIAASNGRPGQLGFRVSCRPRLV
jgi:hypothetical protein